jgi:hypothetical protein
MSPARRRKRVVVPWLKRHWPSVLGALTVISVVLNIYQMTNDASFRRQYDALQLQNIKLSSDNLAADNRLRQRIDRLQVENTRLTNATLSAALQPQLIQQHIIISGREFRALGAIDWRARILAGETTGFVETPLGNRFRAAVAASDQYTIDEKHGVFLQILNAGSVQAVNVRLVLDGGRAIPIGTLSPRSSKYVLIEFEQERPYRREVLRAPRLIEFQYSTGSGLGSLQVPYVAPSARSWTPSLSAERGMGSAIIGGTRSHLIPDES